MILVHVSDVNVDVLQPGSDGYIYLSEGCFISHFGKFVYLFNKMDLMKSGLPIEEQYSDGLAARVETSTRRLDFHSKALQKEFRVAAAIDIKKFALGVIEHWNHLDGNLVHTLGEVMQRFELQELIKEGGIENERSINKHT